MQGLYISRVIIKNFRNFKDVDVNLNHKQVIVGENNVGKTNFLKALQLILDPSLSDEERHLEESDFNNSIETPVANDEEILIQVYINNYINNKTVLAMLSDATIIEDGEERLLLSYKYYPIEFDNGEKIYTYDIFMGDINNNKKFTSSERKFLNIKVIKALRDVERELKNNRFSPINNLLKEYKFDKDELQEIANEIEASSKNILELDEVSDITKKINEKFKHIFGTEQFNISLKTLEIDPNKMLNSLKLFMSNRSVTEVSLGINNILYISLVIQLLQDITVPTLIKDHKYKELKELSGHEILDLTYIKNERENYILKSKLTEEQLLILYNFMEENNSQNKGTTILAIEEPEAHLHPVYQRLIYRDIIKNNNNSVLLTTHSTHITAISPIETIVHLHSVKGVGTKINSTESLDLGKDLKDIERYLDIKRGEIYLAKGIILVEGVTEEYMIPRYADLLDMSLDEMGIVVCNINSTNFKPYVKLLKKLCIPYSIITDGDFYYTELTDDGKEKRKYNEMLSEDNTKNFGYLGLEIIEKIINDGKEKKDCIEVTIENAKLHGYYIGKYTFEIDMMEKTRDDDEAKRIICDVFNELTIGGDNQKENFANELNSRDFLKCLSKIENNGIGKGRFAQKLSAKCTESHISLSIKEAIEYIYHKVENNNEW